MYSSKRFDKIKESVGLLFVIVVFLLLTIFLPVYDEVNGFHNIILDEYNLTWYDMRSPMNFFLIKNILQNNSITFRKGDKIAEISVENLYDLSKVNEKFRPNYSFQANYIFAGILKILPISNELQLFKALVLLNIIFSALILFIFYQIQKLIGLNKKYCLISTFIAGIATSLLIYPRYLILDHTLMNLSFLLFFYIILRNWEKQSLKSDISLLILFSLYIVLSFNLYMGGYVTIFIAIIFSYFLIKYKIVKSIKFYFLVIFTVLVVLFLISLVYTEGIVVIKSPSSIFSVVIFRLPIFSAFPEYINSLDFMVYKYHDPSSVWKLDRYFSFLFYAFREPKGNAIFLNFYGIFSSLFGPKGIIYNSPFLLFMIPGIFIFKGDERKKLILVSIILFIFVFSFLNPIWEGGVTPRYNRFLLVPALFFTFFSFYYLQETKNIWIKLLFIILVILSILNVVALSVRADWTYEHEADLFSNDLVVWPWYPPIEEHEMNLVLYSESEQVRWNFNKDQCVYKESGRGIITDICFCVTNSSTFREIYIPWNSIEINVKACADEAGKDGTLGYFKFDDLSEKIFIRSKSCEERHLILNNTIGLHRIELQSEIFGKCGNEWIVWKEISIKKFFVPRVY